MNHLHHETQAADVNQAQYETQKAIVKKTSRNIGFFI
jgi:hypothetical protein